VPKNQCCEPLAKEGPAPQTVPPHVADSGEHIINVAEVTQAVPEHADPAQPFASQVLELQA
jgi:hypothetical protein